jgi:GNAT superfamily N-acetyltransferase
MHPHLTYIIAQQRAAEAHRRAERSRRTAPDPFVLADGRRLNIRPTERRDRDRLRRLFMRLTPESRYQRYLSPKPTLSERDLDRLLDIDHVKHEALAAVDDTTGAFEAVARYVQLPDQPEVAEVAIEVADDLHRQGIGMGLALRTIEQARANGFTRLIAITLHDNAAARSLLRFLHFHPQSRHGLAIEFARQLTPDLAIPLETVTSHKDRRVHPVTYDRRSIPCQMG